MPGTDRECGVTPADVTNCTKFKAGIEPKQARYGRSYLAKDALYSGVLECPCTERWGGSPVFYPGAKTKVNGSNCEPGGKNCKNFTKRCTAAWDGHGADGGDLLSQRNPTCWSATYAGGLQCCRDRTLLLDLDQDPGPVLLRYHMKFRFWFQEYTPAASMTMPPSASMAILTSPPRPSHYHVPRYYYLTERDAGEYDVPPAFRGVRDPDIPGYEGFPISTSADDLVLTPGSHCTGDCPHGPTCACYHQITSHFEMKTGSSSRGSPAAASMVYAGGHCHAPACLSIELYMNNTGTPELLCRQVSLYGKGDVAVDRFDEAGYVILPPCLWGTAEEGLQPPVYLAQGTPMYSIQRTRNTHVGHTGQMASWQMRGVPFAVEAEAPRWSPDVVEA